MSVTVTWTSQPVEGARFHLRHGALPSLVPENTTATDKMASENNSESQDEQAALTEAEAEHDVHQLCAKQSESKLTLYHWTQSFNSQKVSVHLQHPRPVDSSCTRKHPHVSISITLYCVDLRLLHLCFSNQSNKQLVLLINTNDKCIFAGGTETHQ